MTLEEMMKDYDRDLYYIQYVNDWILANVDDKLWHKTFEAALESLGKSHISEHDVCRYALENGFADGSKFNGYSFDEFVEKDFPTWVLALEIEDYMDKRGEYEKMELPWLGSEERTDFTSINVFRALCIGSEQDERSTACAFEKLYFSASESAPFLTEYHNNPDIFSPKALLDYVQSDVRNLPDGHELLVTAETLISEIKKRFCDEPKKNKPIERE